MKKLNEIKEEVYKCSKCGLCKSVCPIYLATKNELYSPRGRNIILNQFFLTGQKLSKKFIKDLDVCLNCNVCKEFCPSSIDFVDNVILLKNIFKFKYSFLSFSTFYKMYLYFSSLKRRKYKIDFDVNSEIVYFEGCYNNFIDSSDKEATVDILKKLGFKILRLESSCCGYPHYSDGDFTKFKENAENIFSKLENNVKYIICSCDTCYDTLIKALEYIENGSEYKEKLITLSNFLKLKNVQIDISKSTVFYSKNMNIINDGMNLANRKNFTSLVGNFFLFKYPRLAKNIAKKMYAEIENINTLVTSCNLAKWSFSRLFKILGFKTKVISFSEFIKSLLTDLK